MSEFIPLQEALAEYCEHLGIPEARPFAFRAMTAHRGLEPIFIQDRPLVVHEVCGVPSVTAQEFRSLMSELFFGDLVGL